MAYTAPVRDFTFILNEVLEIERHANQPGFEDVSADLVGQRVRVRIKAGQRAALAVPRRFISTRYGVDFVRLVDRSGQTSDVAVQLAPTSDPAQVEILSGLAAGDTIIVPGAGS